MESSPQQPPAPHALREGWAALRAQQPRLRIRDAARALGTSEAQLLATGLGDNVARLGGDWPALLHRLPALGPVMALTRNEHAVHEKTGTYQNVSVQDHTALVLDHDIDLRIFLSYWHLGFMVRDTYASGERDSLQFFDRHGEAIHKIYRGEQTDADAWLALTDAFRVEGDADDLGIVERQPAAPPRPDAEIDQEGFRAAWRALEDTHHFFGLLRRFGVTRTQGLRLAPDDLAWRVQPGSLRRTLEGAAGSDLPIMVFVGSPGVIQIHTGPVRKVVATGPWFNVLDPGFNLHLREDAIAAAWIVRKPTADGVVTSLELFNAQDQTIAMLFGARKPGVPEDPAWRRLAESMEPLSRTRFC